MKQLEAWLGYVMACLVDLPMQAPACVPVWYWVMVACLVIGAGTLVWIWRGYRRHRKDIAARKAAEEYAKEVAPPEVMAQHRWAGDDAIAPHDAQLSVRPPLTRPER